MRTAFLSFVALVLATASFAQGPWVKKDWKQWSKDDCKKVLEESPWAQRWSESNAKTANFATRTRGTSGVGSESELEVYYLMQFRSALPIREAVVRQALIASGYDRLEPPKQKDMEKQTEGFLNRTYDDVIVVHVIYGSNVQEYNRDLATYWQTHYPEGTVPQEAFLNGPKGQKVSPIRLISPKGAAQEFELIFPRQVDGKPLLEPGDKKISVEFMVPSVGSVDSQGRVTTSSTDTRVFREFNVDKMTLNGQIVY
ncbi:MAG TPA: hypothetical protein VKE93_09980 [Candidatus Angelobacter sp.]|nr:hypothetical protein [Candidatus Angelobacter sp.]